jgi:hypothetical protein
MKLPKKVYLAAAALLFVGGGVTATLLLKNDPKQVTLKQASTITSQPAEQAQDTTQTSEDTAPVQQTAQATETPAPDPQPTPEENKAKVMQQITDYALTKGGSDNTVYAETTCFDRVISGSIGYASYDDLLNPDKFAMLQAYLDGKFMFDGTTCKQMWLGQN